MTIFQKEVLQKLREVPRGRVTTYQALAKALGRPRASRAVGNALHVNPEAPRVPCHRVVCSNGLLGGYAGGKRKKIALLASEGVFIKKNAKLENFKDILYSF